MGKKVELFDMLTSSFMTLIEGKEICLDYCLVHRFNFRVSKLEKIRQKGLC